MSTIFFGLEELANVVQVATDDLDESLGKLAIQRAQAVLLDAYSDANAKAYNERYVPRVDKTPAVGHNATQILCFAREPGPKGDREKASGFLRLATYNLDDFETPALRRVVALLSAMVST